jgi:hypothetical protein
MKISILFSLILLLSIQSIKAQLEYESYNWSDTPAISELDTVESEYPAVIIKETVILEQLYRRSGPETYRTEHRIIHINNDAGIEKYNKIYIPIFSDNQILDLKVRAISPSGKVTPIQRKNIKELKNVEGFVNVKIFAIEGLEVGGEAEYLYTIKSGFEPFGREKVQRDIPIREARILLFYPNNWIFKTKAYNGLPGSQNKKVSKNKKCTFVTANSIEAFNEEEYALYEPKLMRFEYKLFSNGYQNNLFSWSFLGYRLVANLSAPKGLKVGNKFTKELQNTEKSTEDKIRALENKIKSTIKLQKVSGDDLSDPNVIIKTGVANSRGITKLFIYCLASLNIKNELVFCSNRYDGELDPGFANPSDISDIIIYFPEFDTYLMPDAYHMRYGVAHPGLMGTNALFTKYVINNKELEYWNYYFKEIKVLDVEHNHMGVIANIDFEEDLSLPLIEIENYSQGYRAFALRSAYYYSDKSIQDEIIKDIALSSFESFDIHKSVVEGSDITLSSYPEKYFKIKMEYTTSELVERAGNDYLIAVGKIIGKQSELYQEKERQHDIEFHSISNYHHEITLNIPEGYSIEGLENINIHNKVILDGEDVMYFISDYSQTDNTIKISVDEIYSVIELPKSYYNDFRKVVNSAADFNKLTLVLTKEQK